MDITLKINWAENRILVMFVYSLQNQIKWFLANTWTETLTDGSAICCCQVKNQENWHWLHCWEGNYSCDKICKPMHYAYMWNGFLFIGFLLANQSLTDARAICCHTTKSILPCYIVGKKRDPGILDPELFLAQIRKVEARLGKLAKIRKSVIN